MAPHICYDLFYSQVRSKQCGELGKNGVCRERGGAEGAGRYKGTSEGVWGTEGEERGEKRYRGGKNKPLIQKQKTTEVGQFMLMAPLELRK